mmetsp:Transcript_30379/g.92774  ORF Transcript_30379/g.92774 Transcript_30379/m.92774 type:complete len:113 (-) Transcript_30379:175-513(-)
MTLELRCLKLMCLATHAHVVSWLVAVERVGPVGQSGVLPALRPFLSNGRGGESVELEGEAAIWHGPSYVGDSGADDGGADDGSSAARHTACLCRGITRRLGDNAGRRLQLAY